MSTRNSPTEEIPAILCATRKVRRGAIEALLRSQPKVAPALALALEERLGQGEQAVEECQAALSKLQGVLEELTRPPLRLGAVLASEDGRCLVTSGGIRQEVVVHPDLRGQTLTTGEVVALNAEGNVLVKRLSG